MDKDRLQTIEDSLRKAFEEQPVLQDIEPPEGFLQSVMEKLPEQTASSVDKISFASRVRESISAFYSLLKRPVTFSATPLQVVASLTLVLCSVFLADFTLDETNGGRQRIAENSQVLPQSVPVRFSLPDPERTFVSAAVIGSFNQWKGKGFEMTYDVDQQAWVLQHELPPGDYKYVFLVNGDSSVADPQAVFYVQDSFGNKNALLQVSGVQHEV